MPKYNIHFNSANWSHDKEKERVRNRRRNGYVKKNARMKMAKEVCRSSYYMQTEAPIYDKIITQIIPAHTEKERSFYIVKGGGDYLYTDKRGKDHYTDLYEWRETGREIYYPERVIVRKHLIGYREIKPILRRDRTSTRKQFTKNICNKLERRLYSNLDHLQDLPDELGTQKNFHTKL